MSGINHKGFWLRTMHDSGNMMLLWCPTLGRAEYLAKDGDSLSRTSEMEPVTHVIVRGKAKRVNVVPNGGRWEGRK